MGATIRCSIGPRLRYLHGCIFCAQNLRLYGTKGKSSKYQELRGKVEKASNMLIIKRESSKHKFVYSTITSWISLGKCKYGFCGGAA